MGSVWAKVLDNGPPGAPGAPSGPDGADSARARLSVAMGQRRDRGGTRWMEAGQEGPPLCRDGAGRGPGGGDPGDSVPHTVQSWAVCVRGCRGGGPRFCVIPQQTHTDPRGGRPRPLERACTRGGTDLAENQGRGSSGRCGPRKSDPRAEGDSLRGIHPALGAADVLGAAGGASRSLPRAHSTFPPPTPVSRVPFS